MRGFVQLGQIAASGVSIGLPAVAHHDFGQMWCRSMTAHAWPLQGDAAKLISRISPTPKVDLSNEEPAA
ncbi:hypothetical protein AB0D27_00535 [Streptomyces sp. NPDC048415]|uniref:hypothetical protein n=1 Tax=Streptomyces sp. NPDC048415 TaxID=3154822 RepID=UPI00342FE6E7